MTGRNELLTHVILFALLIIFIFMVITFVSLSFEISKINEYDQYDENKFSVLLTNIQLLEQEMDNLKVTQVTQNNITNINEYTNVYDKFQERQQSNYCVGSYRIDWDYTVSGQSMLPTIGHGDIAKGVKYTSRKALVPGDIITYTTPEYGDYTHRVVAVYDTYLLAQGDNNEYRDEWRIEYDWVKHVICEIQFT